MALNIANWSDRQLDELTDLLRSADFSAVAAFIATNFMATGDKIMTDDVNSTIKFSVGVDPKTIVVSPGVFMTGGFVSQIDTSQVINILNTSSGTWGTGLIADAVNDRWDIVCIKHADQLNTPEPRWFVNDSVSPNSYSQITVNTLINKAYYDIVVVHGTPNPVPVVPAAPAGYWTVCEIRVTAGSTTINPANVYDTTTGASNRTPPNWSSTSRVLRLEFFGNTFAIDHDPATGFHRSGLWHIGPTIVTSSAAELNKLTGTGVTVTAANLTSLTNGSNIGNTLHQHGVGPQYYIHMQDLKPSGTNGGTFTSGAWRTRDLNTILNDDTGVVTLVTNQFTLPAGTYYMDAMAISIDTDNNQIRLRNISDSSTTLVGLNISTGANDEDGAPSVIRGKFTIATPKTFEIQHRCSLTRNTIGFGRANSFGEGEIYSQVQLWKS
jgi:hypothetical protein